MGTYLKNGRAWRYHVGRDGKGRTVAYVPGDRHWKRTDRQMRVDPGFLDGIVERDELYVAVVLDGDRSRTLVHASQLALT